MAKFRKQTKIEMLLWHSRFANFYFRFFHPLTSFGLTHGFRLFKLARPVFFAISTMFCVFSIKTQKPKNLRQQQSKKMANVILNSKYMDFYEYKIWTATAKNICTYFWNNKYLCRCKPALCRIYVNSGVCWDLVFLFVSEFVMMKIENQCMPLSIIRNQRDCPLFYLKKTRKCENRFFFCIYFGNKKFFIINRISILPGCLVFSNW